MAELSTIARPYAVAAYKLAKEKKALAKWSEMLSFATAVVNDAGMQAYIQDPKVVSADLEAAFLKVAGDKLNEHGQNLVKVLVEYGRLSLLPAITEAFEALKAQEEGTLGRTNHCFCQTKCCGNQRFSEAFRSQIRQKNRSNGFC